MLSRSKIRGKGLVLQLYWTHCSSWAKLCCWQALQFACQVINFCAFLLSRAKSTFTSSVGDAKIAKLPHHLAVVVDSEDALMYLGKIVQLLRLLAQLGLQHVSLYDMEGALKSSITVLAHAFGSDSAVKFYSHDLDSPLGSCDQLPIKSITYAGMTNSELPRGTFQFGGSPQDVKTENPFRWASSQMMVEVLCLHDGKETIVQAARHICLTALDSDALADLKEEDIHSSLRETGGAGPDPDLLLLFSNTRCLLGFPPWRVRLTEILYMGPIRNMTENCLFTALREFSSKRHRYGK